MQNLKNYGEFLNEKAKPKIKRDYREYLDDDYTNLRIKEIRDRIDISTGSSRMDQTVYDEGGALKRLVSGTVENVGKFKKHMSDLFKSQKLKDMDLESLKKDKKGVLSKWGDSIKTSGKNKEKDFETFYKDSVDRGRQTFGKDFDMDEPKSKEERIYRDYVLGASKYFEFEKDGKRSKL